MDQNYVHVDVRNEMKKKKNPTLLEQFQNPMRNKYRNKGKIDISKSNTNTQYPGLVKCGRVKLVNALKNCPQNKHLLSRTLQQYKYLNH